MYKHLVALSCSAILALGSAALLAADDVRMDEVDTLVEQGTIQNLQSLNEKALSVQPGTITDTDLDKHYGRYVYEVEIRDAEGQEWDVDLDASTADVLEHRRDD